MILCAVFGFNAGWLVAPNWGRTKWADKWFDIAIEKNPDLAGALVITTGAGEPRAFLIPWIAAQGTRFLLIAKPFEQIGQQDKLNQLMMDAIKYQRGPVFLITTQNDEKQNLADASTLGLSTPVAPASFRINNNVDPALILVQLR